MNFLEMEANLHPNNYEWYRGVSGSWHHWEKRVLDGAIILHVEGSEDMGYWGNIRCDDAVSHFWSTRPGKEGGIIVPFRTPENCALHVDLAWREMIMKEGNRNKL